MDDFSEIIKLLGVALATLTPLVKTFFGHIASRPRVNRTGFPRRS